MPPGDLFGRVYCDIAVHIAYFKLKRIGFTLALWEGPTKLLLATGRIGINIFSNIFSKAGR